MSFGQIGSWALTAGKVAVATLMVRCYCPCIPGYILLPACVDALTTVVGAATTSAVAAPDPQYQQSPPPNNSPVGNESNVYDETVCRPEDGARRTRPTTECTEGDEDVFYDAEDDNSSVSLKPIPTMLTEVGPFNDIVVGNYKWKFEFGEPSPRTKQVALRELRETPENLRNGLWELNSLLNTERNLKCPRDDLYLLRFLRACKFYPQSAFNLRHYVFRAKHSDIFNDLKPSNMKHIFDENIVVAFPKRDQFGRRVSVFQLGKWNPNRLNLKDIFRISVLYLESAMWEPETQINGVVVIYDMHGLTIPTAVQLKPEFGKLTVEWLQDCVPLRIKGIHFVNEPFYVNSVTNPMPGFMREKYRARCHCRACNPSSLQQYISPECLPTSYGGRCTEPRINGDQWYRFFVQAEREFDALNSYGYNK